MTKCVFLSCASREFSEVRDQLTADCSFPEVVVKSHEEIRDLNIGGTTLEKLDDYISRCNAIIHLFGQATGTQAEPAGLEAILRRHPDLPDRLPQVAPLLAPGAPWRGSYTQWEAYLALYHGVPCHVFIADAKFGRPAGFTFAADDTRLQDEHHQRLERREQDRRTFDSREDLRVQVQRSLRKILPIGTVPFQAEISRIIKYAPDQLIGREVELKLLNDAWGKVAREEKGRPHVLTFVALGGEGKTSLVAKWTAELAHQDWPGCDAVFAWSFYSQGTREQQAASSDLFLKEALTFFGDDADKAFAASPAGAFEKGQRLARIVGQRRSLLILDGLEPLQYAPTSPTPGQLKDQGIAALLKGLAAASHGLCVVTTRYSLPDLKAFWQTTAPEVKLLRLSGDAGVHLLKTLGVRGTTQEFEALVEDVKGHALTLTLLGGFLKRAFHGDIRQRDRVKFEKADEKMDGGHAFRTMAAYEQWLLRDGGDEGRREVAVLRLMGLFDRPADAGCLAALRSETIPGLTEPLAGLADDDWEFCLSGLEAAKLLTVNRDASGALISLDAHPHLREYFAAQLKCGSARAPRAVSGALAGNTSDKPNALESSTPSDQPAGAQVGAREGACAPQTSDAWRAAHRRLYEHLCAAAPECTKYYAWPSDKSQPTLEDLQMLYQAVAHGCQAGLHTESLEKIYRRRIHRQNFYGTFNLGAFGSDLGIITCFFEQPWTRVSTTLSPDLQAWILGVAAFNLRAMGRMVEALGAYRATLAFMEFLNDANQAAVAANNLSELELAMGDVAGAIKDAKQSATYVNWTTDPSVVTSVQTTNAEALHQAGRLTEAETCFREAEQIQVEDDADHPLLYSLGGFRYCDLLLIEPERTAWQTILSLWSQPSTINILDSCRVVSQRAAQTLQWATEEELNLLSIALDHLTLGRTALYAAVLESCGHRREGARSLSTESQRLLTASPTIERAGRELDAAVAGLRRSGEQIWLTAGLLTRAWLRFLTGVRTGPESAQEDLDEAWEIAERGPMKLHMANIHLHRARLFFREKEYPWIGPQADLAAAEKLINECGYHRRDKELADAKAAILSR